MTKALSLTVFAELNNVTDGQTDGQTDRQNWYGKSRPDAARYALASVATSDRLVVGLLGPCRFNSRVHAYSELVMHSYT